MRTWIFLGLGLLLVSCEEPARFEGFSRTESGLEYRLYELGERDSTLKTGHFVTMRVAIHTLTDSLVFANHGKEYETALFFDSTALPTAWMEAFELLLVGDSASFIMRGAALSAFPGPRKEAEYKVHLRVLDLELPDGFAFHTRYPVLWEQFPEHREVFSEWLPLEETVEFIDLDGLYVLVLEPGQGSRPSFQDDVEVFYEAYFPDGSQFDATAENEPFEYTIGEQGQALLGFDLGIRQLREGGKAILILPASLAFAERGSTDGTVPPNATVLYRVHLRKVIPYVA